MKKITTAITLSLVTVFGLSTNASADYYIDQTKVSQLYDIKTGEGLAKYVLEDAFIKNYAFISVEEGGQQYATRFGKSYVHKIKFKTKFLGTEKFMHFAIELPEDVLSKDLSKDKKWLKNNIGVKVLQFQDAYSTQFPPGHFTH